MHSTHIVALCVGEGGVLLVEAEEQVGFRRQQLVVLLDETIAIIDILYNYIY